MGIIRKALSVWAAGFLLASCASNDVPAPQWASDLRGAYPESTYLSGLGRGTSRDEAKNDAASELARYLRSTIQSQTNASLSMTQSGNSTESTKSIDRSLSVTSNVELSGLEYTEPYFDKAEKKWKCAAYVSRDKAWEQVVPAVEGARTKFLSLYNNALSELEPLARCRQLGVARSGGSDFINELAFARLVNLQKASVYDDDKRKYDGIPALQAEVRNGLSVFVTVDGDHAGIIVASLSKSLSESGFRVVKKEADASYVARASISDNAVGNEPVAIYPSLELDIRLKGGKSVYAKNLAVEKKTVSYEIDTARRKSYPLLSDMISTSVTAEVGALLGTR